MLLELELPIDDELLEELDELEKLLLDDDELLDELPEGDDEEPRPSQMMTSAKLHFSSMKGDGLVTPAA